MLVAGTAQWLTGRVGPWRAPARADSRSRARCHTHCARAGGCQWGGFGVYLRGIGSRRRRYRGSSPLSSGPLSLGPPESAVRAAGTRSLGPSKFVHTFKLRFNLRMDPGRPGVWRN
jgi:hypothetical protein